MGTRYTRRYVLTYYSFLPRVNLEMFKVRRSRRRRRRRRLPLLRLSYSRMYVGMYVRITTTAETLIPPSTVVD